ncbi:MAG: phosphoribosylglycinamide formyltransferase [Streptosporangiales bacterium]|nr:phosphoribosylglycinamide formyltransferase [Streptosporangiales bacterium]
MAARLVVLVSGTGTNLQALLDACADPGYGVRVVAVGADRDGILGLERARGAGIPTFVVRSSEHTDRAAWDRALAEAVAAYAPDIVVLAGFMKIIGTDLLERFPNRIVNTHPALLPSFPGAHAVRDTLAYGVKVTGVTIHLVDAGVDSGPVVAQAAVPVHADDEEELLHERIKAVEHRLLVDTVGTMAREGYSVQGRTVRLGAGAVAGGDAPAARRGGAVR